MNSLKVTKDWFNWFLSKGIQFVTSIDDGEMFSINIHGQIEGQQLNYATVFKFIEAFKISFDFLAINHIRLAWSEGVESKNLQFFKEGEDFSFWKENVLSGNSNLENSFLGDYEDPTEVFFDYSIDVEGEDASIYQDKQTDRATIHLWFNPQANETGYSVGIELRKALFSIDQKFDIHLPEYCIEQNKMLFEQAEENFLNHLKTIS